MNITILHSIWILLCESSYWFTSNILSAFSGLYAGLFGDGLHWNLNTRMYKRWVSHIRNVRCSVRGGGEEAQNLTAVDLFGLHSLPRRIYKKLYMKGGTLNTILSREGFCVDCNLYLLHLNISFEGSSAGNHGLWFILRFMRISFICILNGKFCCFLINLD